MPRAGVMPPSLRSVIKAPRAAHIQERGHRPDLFLPPEAPAGYGIVGGRKGQHLPHLLSAGSSRSGNVCMFQGSDT